MTATAPQQKITYTSTNVDLSAFHQAFDDALAAVREAAGKSHPLWIDGKAVEAQGRDPITDVSPIDTSLTLGIFTAAGPEHVDLAVKAAVRAQKAWARLPWQERVRILRQAATIIRERKFELSAIMALEVG